MDVNMITSLIGTVGFPIVCVIGMAWFVYKQLQTHKEETDKMTEALNNNTKVLSQILEHIREQEDDKK